MHILQCTHSGEVGSNIVEDRVQLSGGRKVAACVFA